MISRPRVKRDGSLGRAFPPVLLVLLCVLLFGGTANAGRRQGDRFGIRVGAWPQQDVSGDLAVIRFHSDPDTLYRAAVDEPGKIVPFFEIYGLFNVKGIWWAEISMGFSQRTGVEVSGIQTAPASNPGNPKGDSTENRILFGEGRVDFFPMFLGLRAVHDLGHRERPHNIYARGGLSLLIASEQPSLVHPRLKGTAYTEGTKGAFGFLVGGGGEYYFSPRFGLAGDLSYRLSDLNYTKNGNFNLSSLWLSAGVVLHIR